MLSSMHCNKQDRAVDHNDISATVVASSTNDHAAELHASLQLIPSASFQTCKQGSDGLMPAVEQSANEDNVASLSGLAANSSDLDLEDMPHDGMPDDILPLASHFD